MPATADAIDVRTLDLKKLDPHPNNPRVKLTLASVADLQGLIAASGLLSPLLVREKAGGRFEVLDGNRRAFVLERLGRDSAACIVRDVDDADALAIMLSANEGRADVDPFLEALAIEALILADGTVKHAAQRLGKDVRWVAQRRALGNLSETWRKKRASEPWSAWDVAAWEIIARLSPEGQEVLASKADGALRYVLGSESPRLDDLEREVKNLLRVIGKAPFDPEDAKLVRAAGPCGTCPKTSQSVPGLFDDGEPTDLASATCRDAGCWGKKCAAALRAKVAGARLEDGFADAQVALREGAIASGVGRALKSYRWTEAKKGDKGATPIVVVGKTGAVSTAYAKIGADPYAVAGVPSRAQKTEPPASRLARLERDRAAAIEDGVDDALIKACTKAEKDPPGALAIVACALVFGASQNGSDKDNDASLKLAIDALAGDATLAAVACRLWESVVDSIDMEGGLGSWAGVDVHAKRRGVICSALGLKLDDVREGVAKDLGESKELISARAALKRAAEKENGAPLKPAATSSPKPPRKGSKKAKAAALAARVSSILKTKKGAGRKAVASKR